MLLETSTLILQLQSHFNLNLSRAKCFAMMILSLIECRSVNLTHMSSMVIGPVDVQSTYKRMRRFLKEIAFDPTCIARFIFIILDISTHVKVNLILDRTNWKIGRLHVNILYLAVSYQGIGFPLFFSLLEDKKSGNSDHLDRIDKIEIFIKTFGKERIDAIYADREFIGDKWINWLQEQGISYTIRIKEDGQYIANARGRIKLASTLFRGLKNGECISIGGRDIGKKRLYNSSISALRNTNGELVVLIHSASVIEPFKRYRERWQIELLFRMMKTGGFNLESTHVTDPDRMEVLLAIVAIATTIAAKAGMIHEEIQPTPIKKHGFKAKNTIRLGIDNLICIMRNITDILMKNKILMKIISFINHTFDAKRTTFYSKNIGDLKIVP